MNARTTTPQSHEDFKGPWRELLNRPECKVKSLSAWSRTRTLSADLDTDCITLAFEPASRAHFAEQVEELLRRRDAHSSAKSGGTESPLVSGSFHLKVLEAPTGTPLGPGTLQLYPALLVGVGSLPLQVWLEILRAGLISSFWPEPKIELHGTAGADPGRPQKDSGASGAPAQSESKLPPTETR